MKYRFLIAIIFSTLNITAQSYNDHLVPVENFFNIKNYQFEYHSNVRNVLFDGLAESPIIRFQEMPSFTPESVLDIRFDELSSNYFLVFHRCEEMVWLHKNPDKIQVIKHQIEIDQKSVDLIKSLFDKVLISTKYPKKDIIGFDGTTYYFSTFSNNQKTGMIWSPNNGSAMRELVEIALDLVKLAESGNQIIKLPNKIERRTYDLITRLNE